MRIVITNDDGFGEPGIEALRMAMEPLGEVIEVAPKRPHSLAGHRITLKQAIAVERIDSTTFIVDGTPADCTRLALKSLAPDADWVVAGINPGANLGTDVYQSGTVAAAREAAILGVKAFAISQYISSGGAIDWGHTRKHSAAIISKLMADGLRPGQYWNVNLPHPLNEEVTPDHVVCDLDRNAHDYTYVKAADGYMYKGVIHNRPRDIGADVDVCFGGRISVTCLEI